MKNIKMYTFLCLSLLLLGGCDKWINVEPKTSIDDERMFSNEQGFKEALNGVYLLMADPAIYGREFSFGMTDVLGGMYVLSEANGSLRYRQLRAGLYTNVGPEELIVKAWEKSFNAIANVNNIVAAIDRSDVGLFTQNNANLIKGEALGLRAFLHFDLLRLFGTAYANNGANEKSIPYVRLYGTNINPRLTSQEVIALIRQDLKDAMVLLERDPIHTGQSVTGTDNDLLLNRKLRFNYYAAKALLARVELWADNKTAALTEAEDILEIAQQKFPWIAQNNIATANETQRDRVFTTEHIFGLYVNDLAVNYRDLLDTSRFNSTLIINASRITQQFETASAGASDYRNVYLIRALTNIPSPKTFFGKFYQSNGMPAAYAKRIPLIKIPEMYYIAAECLVESNPQKAIEYLSTVRRARGIVTPYANNLTATQIHDEIRKEYWKEFPLEGQLFYYFKRLNSTAIPGVTGTFNRALYKLPLPPREIEFGQ